MPAVSLLCFILYLIRTKFASLTELLSLSRKGKRLFTGYRTAVPNAILGVTIGSNGLNGSYKRCRSSLDLILLKF